ncbi:MAG TPA: hypothetical protein PKX78_04405, partial [Candidatus Woesebacteria bacterium]|nr:hypothetical protein [Candidatus Woesebacteria bacterium]
MINLSGIINTKNSYKRSLGNFLRTKRDNAHLTTDSSKKTEKTQMDVIGTHFPENYFVQIALV